MNVIGVDSYWQPLVIGVIILGGVLFDMNRSRLSLGRKGRVGANASHAGEGVSPETDRAATLETERRKGGDA